LGQVAGPYARRIFSEELGLDESRLTLLHAEPKPDFGGGHADPNLVHAVELMHLMGVDQEGMGISEQELEKRPSTPPPAFGSAADGDADRNIIFGNRTFVNPADSLAVLTAHVVRRPLRPLGRMFVLRFTYVTSVLVKK
jgi:phosphoglucomutase